MWNLFSQIIWLQGNNRKGCWFFRLEAVDSPFAVATAQAKKMGYKNFDEDSPGQKKRDEIAEAIKRK